jgi:hypothetical protein
MHYDHQSILNDKPATQNPEASNPTPNQIKTGQSRMSASGLFGEGPESIHAEQSEPHVFPVQQPPSS